VKRIRALLYGQPKEPRYRVIDRSSGATLGTTNDYGARYRIVESLIERGFTWETLDVIDADGNAALHGALGASFGSLTIARTVPDAIAVADIPGDGLLLTCPIPMVACSESQLSRLADELQAVCHGWEPEYHAPMLWFLPPDVGEDWGMPGGFVQDRVWVADEVEQFGWVGAVNEFVSGARDALPQPLDGRPIQILWMVRDRMTDEARERLRLVVEAATLGECQARREELAAWLRRSGQDRAAEALTGDPR
jgi:hypothetical protein